MFSAHEKKAAGEGASASQEDLVDLSDGARAKLQETEEALLALTQGRGKLADDEVKLIREQLQEISKQLEVLGQLAGQGDPASEEAAFRGLEQLQGSLKNIGHRLGLMDDAVAVDAGAANHFQSVVKGFRQQLKELDEMFRDENRVPPGLLTVLREMSTFPRPKEDAVSQLV